MANANHATDVTSMPQRTQATAQRKRPSSNSRVRAADPEANPLLETLTSLLNRPETGEGHKASEHQQATGNAAAAPDKSNGRSAARLDDPFESLAAAVSAAAAAVEHAQTNGKARTRKQRGAPNDAVGKAIYSAAYGFGYSVALPTFLLIGMLPDNAVGRGLKDGAKAAQQTVERRRKR